jgi:hypothetical protein
MGGVGLAGMAGCADEATSGPSSDTQTGGRSVVQDVAVDAGHLVVRLREDHDVTGVTLIAPDGTLFTEHSVAVGVTTVRLELLDIQPGLGGYDHYEPGEYELVAVRDQESVRVPVDLQPDLRIVSVRQYRDGDRPSDLGKLVVEVENVGTGPTWVHDITYRDAPNWVVNNPLSSDPGILKLTQPTNPTDAILSPNGSSSFVGITTPILFVGDSTPSCSSVSDFSVIIGTAVRRDLEVQIRAMVSGTAQLAGPREYTCDEISVQMLSDDQLEQIRGPNGGR